MLARRVPLARRNLFQDRRRALLSVCGVAVALLLVLILDGIYAGAMRQVTAYLEGLPADVIVSQAGVKTMHMSSSSLPAETIEAVRRVDGVEWVEPIAYTTSVVHSATGRELSYVIGYDAPGGKGGPSHVVSGGEPGPGELLLDETAADQLGIGLGEDVEVFGAPFKVSGLFSGGTSIVNTTAFIRNDDFAKIRGHPISYLLVGASPGVGADELAGRLAAGLPQATVQSRREFVGEEASVVRDMAADVMWIMTTIGFAIALAVVALTLYTATLAKLPEYGVLKAIGIEPGRLAGTVVAQAAWAVGAALAVALVLAVVVGVAVAALTPNVRLSYGFSSIARTAVGALVVGAFGALVPIRRVIRVDPMSVFRR